MQRRILPLGNFYLRVMIKHFFFCVFMYRDVVEVHKRARQYPSHLEYDRTSLALGGLNLGLSRKLFLRDTVASPERARTCALVWPVTTQDLAHLVRSHS